MKQYTKPTVSVVELSVKESIAALPVAIRNTMTTSVESTSSGNVILTTYNLAAASTSELNNA